MGKGRRKRRGIKFNPRDMNWKDSILISNSKSINNKIKSIHIIKNPQIRNFKNTVYGDFKNGIVKSIPDYILKEFIKDREDIDYHIEIFELWLNRELKDWGDGYYYIHGRSKYLGRINKLYQRNVCYFYIQDGRSIIDTKRKYNKPKKYPKKGNRNYRIARRGALYCFKDL